MQLNDRLYTSTEVAEILGVSLRSVYRYLEDGKLEAEIKTATGRLRFTKQNIMDFLQPGSSAKAPVSAKMGEGSNKPVVQEAEVVPEEKPAVSTEEAGEDKDVDWLKKFRASAEKFKKEQSAVSEEKVVEEPVAGEVATPVQTAEPEPEAVVEEETPVENVSGLVDVEPEKPKAAAKQTVYYYRSLVGGLKDIAQNIDKVARRSSVEYAFTLSAGLSLYKPLKDPFSVLHAYVRLGDRDLFEKLLRLVPSDEPNAQLCLVVSGDEAVFSEKVELHGLFVVSKTQLRKDISDFDRTELLEELDPAS